MRAKHTDKIRATFYIDKELYQLLKRCSAVEEIPMSSIINNDILEERVGRYRYSCLDEWEHERYELQQEKEAEEFFGALEEEAASPIGKLKTRIKQVQEAIEKKKLSTAVGKVKIQELQDRLNRVVEEERAKLELKKKEFDERWKRALSEIPLS